jgi:hypothetical protein
LTFPFRELEKFVYDGGYLLQKKSWRQDHLADQEEERTGILSKIAALIDE